DGFVFVHHSDPTKVLIGERERAKGEVKLLTMTEGRVVPLVPLVTSGDSNDSIDKLFDEGDNVGQEHPAKRNDDVYLEAVAQDAPKVVVEKTKKLKRKRKVIGDASCATHPPKKLRDDYHAATSDTSRKSLAVICSLIQEGFDIPSGVTEPCIIISVAPTSNAGPTDYVSGLNLLTHPPGVRYVVSSDGSHHSSSYSKANSFTRSLIADTPVVTVAVTNTVVSRAFAIPILRARVESKNLETFSNSASVGGANADATNILKLNKPFPLSDSFYASAEVRMRAEHALEKKGELEDKCAEQDALLSEKNAEIANLKSLLSLKEAEAAEAIRLRSQLSVVEVADAAKGNDLKDLK
ncbi:hypothetical protein Tco_1390975, partial [Tanacetum coccineum]